MLNNEIEHEINKNKSRKNIINMKSFKTDKSSSIFNKTHEIKNNNQANDINNAQSTRNNNWENIKLYNTVK